MLVVLIFIAQKSLSFCGEWSALYPTGLLHLVNQLNVLVHLDN